MQQINSRSFIRFLMVGGSATALHYLLIFIFVQAGWLTPVSASAVGFVISALFNYWANARFTFSGPKQHRRSLPRFIVTTLTGCLINLGILRGLLALNCPFILAQVCATGVVLIWNYIINALWTFRHPHP